MEDVLAPSAEPGAPPALPAAEKKPRRRARRTVALIAGAAVLGAVAGVCAGYAVQAERDPDPLPPLAQPRITQAEGGKPPEPLSASADHRVRTDGDLRRLLVPRPGGTRKSDGQQGWVDQHDFAEYFFKKPGPMFGELSDEGFRRAAVTVWEKGNASTSVQLVQFRDAEERGSLSFLDGQLAYMPGDKWAGNAGEPIPHSFNGRAFVSDHAKSEPGYVPMYSARALAVRGDIAMDIQIYDTRPIRMKTVMDLAERQLERL
ncbi:hypothetical protein [Streptomyces xanthii]|uniref:hypothetical protein n=1 Tax=Streptomyces xanthii TaxID=2768069 RepID=UPI001CB7873F|nr:hypothetical protein [Streptomyces xanthii]